MSLKLVELQVALPKAQDVSKIHEQIHHRGQHMQNHITTTKKIEDDKNRKKVINNKQKEKSSMHLKDKNPTQFIKKNLTHEGLKEQHPYKGNTIDISG
jgi:ketol-acid reductoisomerase